MQTTRSINPMPEGTRYRDAFVMSLAQALHLFGTPAHRLEQAVACIARDLDMQLQILATPTSVTLAIGELDNQRTFLLRVEPSEANLEKLAELQDVMQQVGRGELAHQKATEMIDEIVARPPRYGVLLTIIAFALTSACAAILFGGTDIDAGISAAIGLLIGMLTVFSKRSMRLSMLLPAVSAAVAATFARLAAHYIGDIHPFVVTLASLIVLLPGLSLTVGVNELAHRHLVSGTARLMGALVVLLQLGLGVAAGWGFANTLWGSFATAPVEPAGIPLLTAAVIGAAIAFTILFKAHQRDFIAVLLGAALAYTSARVGTELYNPEFGAALGAWSMGTLANILARLRNKPALTTILPGIILLVPGTMGFRSVQAILNDEVIMGVETAATTIMVAMALVVGLFLSNLTVSPRKIL